MTRVQPITREKASPKVSEIYGVLEKKMGKVLNIFQNMGNSPAVLSGFLGLSEAANHTSLNPKLREEIALTVGQANSCNYCLSAHTAAAGFSGMSKDDIIKARKGEASNPKDKAILSFTKSVIEKRAQVTDQDVENLKAAGVTDTEIVEIILVIAVNLFTNYFNLITDPKIDFPLAPKL